LYLELIIAFAERQSLVVGVSSFGLEPSYCHLGRLDFSRWAEERGAAEPSVKDETFDTDRPTYSLVTLQRDEIAFRSNSNPLYLAIPLTSPFQVVTTTERLSRRL
jgi:hypothetical protein